MSIKALSRAAPALLAPLLDLIYPPRCAACGSAIARQTDLLCRTCRAAFSPQFPRRCPLCCCPLEVDVTSGEPPDASEQDPDSCPNCGEWAPYFDRLLVLAPFSGPVQQAIHALKFKQYRKLGRELGRHIAVCPDLADGLAGIDLLVPVPLHPARQRERGYNQSLLIAEGVGETAGIAIEINVLRRVRATRQQATLDAEDRAANQCDAFEVRGFLSPECRVGLVDDVVTTGATLDACARALKASGVRQVSGIAVASPFRLT